VRCNELYTPSVIPPTLSCRSCKHPLRHCTELKDKLAALCGVEHVTQQWCDLTKVVLAGLQLRNARMWIDVPDGAVLRSAGGCDSALSIQHNGMCIQLWVGVRL
jgi:hypothetical protein